MHYYFFLLRESLSANWPKFALFGGLSGVASASVLAVINQAAVTDADGWAGLLVVLLLAVLVYSLSHRALMVSAAALSESTVDHLRIALEEKLRSADLRRVEKLDQNRIYATISGEMQALADGTVNLAIVGHSLFLVIVTAVYLLYLSVTAVIASVIFSSLAAYIHLRRSKETAETLSQAFRLDAQLLHGFSDLIAGFKEVKLNVLRSQDLGKEIQDYSAQVASVRLHTRTSVATDLVLSQSAFYLLIGLMAFVVPMFVNIDRQTMTMITAGTLFLIGPIGLLVAGIPILQRVESAAQTILGVLQELPIATEKTSGFNPVGFPEDGFIKLAHTSFTYNGGDDGSFSVGPIDLEVRQGQLVLITGSNGSGKSTLLKLITGLYVPTSGVITAGVEVDRVKKEIQVSADGNVAQAAIETYQNLFSAVFSDYHLFKKLYGIRSIDQEEANKWLQLVEFQDKVHIVGREFDTVNLSSGQRKRLAMVTLLLENRPIFVFDEWAADQDKHFRDKFYFTILPLLLKVYQKTVIVVSHDLEYFKSEKIPAHERFHMELDIDAENHTRALLRKLKPGEDPFSVSDAPGSPNSDEAAR
jgi:putative pyoverdin transport system ATP-binding/permease protein